MYGRIRQGPPVVAARWHLRAATKIGARVRVWGRPSVANGGTMLIGDRVRIDSRISQVALFAGGAGVLELGEGVFLNHGVSLGADLSVRIGARTQIGQQCIVMDNAYHHVEPALRDVMPESEPVDIGRNVWLGARCIVLPGVTIGENSCVAAGSVVTKDVPANVLAAGVPARPLRSI